MKAHLAYLKYVIRHKWFVFLACLRLKVPLWRAIIHDWTKFLPCEWSAYVRSFYNPDGTSNKAKRVDRPIWLNQDFDDAWNHHQKANKHHWQYWVLVTDSDDPRLRPLEMPHTYIREMVADWIGAGRAITGKYEVAQWYEKNQHKMMLADGTRFVVERLLKQRTPTASTEGGGE